MGRGGHGHSHGPNDAAHGHSHSAGHGKFLGCCTCTDTFRLSCMLCMTFSFFLIELIVGHISHSITLQADSFHMFSDGLALCIGLVTAMYSQRKTTKNTYGWVRAEVLGPFINSVFLISLCLGIFIEAIERLIKPERLEDIDLLLYVGSLGLLINLAGLVLFGHGHSHTVPKEQEEEDEDENDDIYHKIYKIEETNGEIKQASNGEQKALVADEVKDTKITIKEDQPKKHKNKCCSILSKDANMNMRAVFLHVLADALGSIIVIISALLNKFQKELNLPDKLINLIDPVLCLGLVSLILSTAIPLLKECGLILLQTAPKEIQVDKLKEELIQKIPTVKNVHELHVWRLNNRKIIATAHMSCHTSTEWMQTAAKVKQFFHKKGICSITVQPEFTDYPNEADACLMECMDQCIEKTCCGEQLAKNKSVASQLKDQT